MDQYNSTYEKAYTRSACLDVENRNTKEPELLLEAPGETPIVLEHKTVVWPPTYLSDHSNEHEFSRRMTSSLVGQFNNEAYLLSVNAVSLKGSRKREVLALADQIARTILMHQVRAKTQSGIRSLKPIPWQFRPRSPAEIEYDEPDSGTRIEIAGSLEASDPYELFQEFEAAMNGFAIQLRRAAESAADKLMRYPTNLKLLLVQFCGSDLLDDEDFVKLIRSEQLPEVIDQLWIAKPDWVSEHDFETNWARVY